MEENKFGEGVQYTGGRGIWMVRGKEGICEDSEIMNRGKKTVGEG